MKSIDDVFRFMSQCSNLNAEFKSHIGQLIAEVYADGWKSGHKVGAEHERAACLGAIEAAASNIVNRHTVEHGGVRAPIPTILDRDLLSHRVRWEQWPNIMRHEYVQARLIDGKPCVQIVVNGEYNGTVLPNGSIVGVSSLPNLSVMSIAFNAALADAREKLSPEGVGALRVPDSRIGLFLFIDSKGNEFELKNTDYGTVIDKVGLVIGSLHGDRMVSVIRHTECALRMCEDYCALTRAVSSFCRWACDLGAVPQFMLNRVNVEGHEGFTVRYSMSRFGVLDFYGNNGVSLTPNSKGGFDELPIIAPHNDKERAIVDAAKRTIRSKFYGNMA